MVKVLKLSCLRIMLESIKNGRGNKNFDYNATKYRLTELASPISAFGNVDA